MEGGKDINGFHDRGDTDTGNNGSSEDVGDALGHSSDRVFFGHHVAYMPTERDAVHYKMDHKHRGFAMIFNHEKFEISGLKNRSGTEEDCKNLKECLAALGFDVLVFKDLKFQEIESQISQMAKRDHSDSDCLIVIILSHGEQGIIYAKDHCYKPEFLWGSFTPDHCATLAGKPKLFFLQACQGDNLDTGITLQKTTETDGQLTNTYRIPLQADFLIVYSTVKGYYSWRNTTKGSWFIQALCKELRERAYTDDILTIMTFVSQRVAFDFESNVPDSPTMHRQKQIPCVMSMLTRLVKFTKRGCDSDKVHDKDKSKSLLKGIFHIGKHSYHIHQ